MKNGTVIYTLWGLAKGETLRWREDLLMETTYPAQLKQAEEQAAAKGYHSFRVGKMVWGSPVDFTKTVRK